MTLLPTSANAELTALSRPRNAVRSGLLARLGPYCTLTKARLSALVLLTTLVGFVLASRTTDGASGGWGLLLPTLLGTAMAAGCANALNQIIERRLDLLMKRTINRPLPARTVPLNVATHFAFALGAVGLFILARFVNFPAALLALVTILIYVFIYTPLKTRTTLNTLVGAVCGALPPMIGWVAVTGTFDAGGFALAALLFIWQIPHFLALAWLYREDYARGGFRMLPISDTHGELTCRVVVLSSLLLVPAALAAPLLGLTGWIYALVSLLAAGFLIAHGIRLYRSRTNTSARRVFLTSLVYLTAVLAVMMVDGGRMMEAEKAEASRSTMFASAPTGVVIAE